MHQAVEHLSQTKLMEELSISIMIADRPYRLVIDKEKEEMVRRAAKLIEKRIKEYSGSYAYKDKQDLIAMAALELTTGFLQAEKESGEKEIEMSRKLSEADKALDEVLQPDV